MSQLKYPLEFSRKQRSILEIKNYKANEFRNILYYLIPVIFFDILPPVYFNHVLTYVTFLRLLTKNDIKENDIMNSLNLINYFCQRFKTLYGDDKLTYKLHTHIHMPAQCIQYGPLHEISCFPFESITLYY